MQQKIHTVKKLNAFSENAELQAFDWGAESAYDDADYP